MRHAATCRHTVNNNGSTKFLMSNISKKYSVAFFTIATILILVTYLPMNFASGADQNIATAVVVPSLRSSTWNTATSAQMVSCTLNTVKTGDVLFEVVQSSGVPQSSLSAIDSGSDSFAYQSNWGGAIGAGAAYTKTTSTGVVTITVTVSNGGADLTLFCYDVAHASTSVTMSQVGSGTGTALSVPHFTVHKNSFLIGISASGASYTTFSAGSGFRLADSAPILAFANYLSSEWKARSQTSPTCPITTSVSQGWGTLCYAIPPA